MRITDAANFFISKVKYAEGESITHLKLQKLLYYAQAYHLSEQGTKMFDVEFQAWAHGPVCGELYPKYRVFGYNPLPAVENFKVSDFPSHMIKILDFVWAKFGQYDARKLEKMTHEELPWIEARGNTPYGDSCNSIISTATMRDYYKGLFVMEEPRKKIKPLFSLDEIRKVASKVDRSVKGSATEYYEVVNKEMDEFRLLRERAAGGWQNKE